MGEHGIVDLFSVEKTAEGTGAPHSAGEAIRAAESAQMPFSPILMVDRGGIRVAVDRTGGR
jgi:hypothetical protein